MNTNLIICGGTLQKYNGQDAKVIIPNSIKVIGKDVFRGQRKLTSIIFLDGLETIGAFAFHMTGLNEVSFPGSLEHIEEKAFHECGTLAHITFSEGLREIGKYAFCGNGCKDITLPNGLRKIGEYAFCDCRNLESITIPNSVFHIGKGAFSMNIKLKSVTIPKHFETQLENIFGSHDNISFAFI